MKLYLVIAGPNYYPSFGTEDWKKTFATREEAEAAKSVLAQEYDWVEIVDLKQWIN
jgi:hypothetical protein